MLRIAVIYLLCLVPTCAFPAFKAKVVNYYGDSIKVENKGAYVLRVGYSDFWGTQRMFDMPTLRSKTINTFHNSKIKLWAIYGKTKLIISKPGGHILCTGTTIIGFNCKYV